MQKYFEVAGYFTRQHPTMMIVMALSVIAITLLVITADRELKRFTRDNPEDEQ